MAAPAQLLQIVNTPVTSVLDHRFSLIGNSFLNLVDSEEDLAPVARTRSRSCPGMVRAQESREARNNEVLESVVEEASGGNVVTTAEEAIGGSGAAAAEEAPTEQVAPKEQEAPTEQEASHAVVLPEEAAEEAERARREAEEALQRAAREQEEVIPEPLSATRFIQQQRAGLKSLPASSRPANLVLVKEAFKGRRSGLSDADTSAGKPSGTDGGGAGSWTEPAEAQPPMSPVSAKSRASWADAWVEEIEEQSCSEAVSPTSPMSPTWALWQQETLEEELRTPASPSSAVQEAWVDESQEAGAQERVSRRATSSQETKDITTLMIQNLPAGLQQKSLSSALDNSGFSGQYDFLYLPTAFGSGASHGYAFVNFLGPAAATRLTELWDRRRPWGRGMEKALHIRPAVLQGLDANVARWNSAKMRRVRNPEHRPMVLPANAAAVEDGASTQGACPSSPVPSDAGGRHGRQRRTRGQHRR